MRRLAGPLMATAVVAASWLVPVGPAAAQSVLSVTVDGNHLVNGQNQTVRLLGVDVPGTEYACEEGWGYAELPITLATAQAIAGWGATAVRVPLNEDCWLGINGQPKYTAPAGPHGYQEAIEDWVGDLNQAGLYVILDLHWSAPGTTVANGQRPMADTHSVAFWRTVAATFKANPAVVFDLFNEPYSPEADGVSTLALTWSCWRDGGCSLPVTVDGATATGAPTYTAVGMQTLVNAVRSAGATTQPLMLGGLSYANDLGGWLANEPTDPDHGLVASFHDYAGNACDSATCWNSTVATVAAQLPVVTGEFDEGFDCVDPPAGETGPSSFDNTFMDWADAHGVSYLAWGWYAPTTNATTCSTLSDGGAGAYSLITGAAGTPVGPDGTNLKDHLATLPTTTTAPPPPTAPTTTTTTAPPPTAPTTSTTSPPGTPANIPGSAGYDLVGSDGGVFVFPTGGAGGTGGYYGSLPGLGVRVSDVVGIVPSWDGRGYFLVGADGGVFSFGDTTFAGSLPGDGIAVDDVVGIVPTADDRGYLLVGRDGGVFAFGDAKFVGSLPGDGVAVDDVVGIASAAGGDGYWVVEADGAVTAFGSADRYGGASAGGSPVSGIAATPAGDGYWVVTANGGVQAYGDAGHFGGLPGLGVMPSRPVVSVVPTDDGGGYWLVGSDGGIFGFGDADNLGSLPGLGVAVDDVVGAAPTTGG